MDVAAMPLTRYAEEWWMRSATLGHADQHVREDMLGANVLSQTFSYALARSVGAPDERWFAKSKDPVPDVTLWLPEAGWKSVVPPSFWVVRE